MTGEGKCLAVLVLVPGEDVRICGLPEGHEGVHRDVAEWTDDQAAEYLRRWTI